MANRRMIIKTLSYSEEFNSISEFAQLLYFVTTPHLDDFGKIDGRPKTLKAMVLPLNNRNIDDFEKAIKELVSAGFIERYEVRGKKIIRYITFEEDQTGLQKRTKSRYPDKIQSSDYFSENLRNTTGIEKKRTKLNSTETNSSEPKNVASNNSFSRVGENIFYPDPNDYPLHTREEVAAKDAWQKLEPSNNRAFYTTYLQAAKKGLPTDLFYQFTSEIQQSESKKPGAVFNNKVKIYLKKQNEQ